MSSQFTVNIALMEGTAPILGVVHTPCLGSTHWAIKGRGAFRRLHGPPGSTEVGAETPTPPDEQIHAAKFSDEDEGLTIMGSSSHRTPDTFGLATSIPYQSLVHAGI